MVQKTLRPWKLHLHLLTDKKVPVYVQIAHTIVNDIKRGRLLPGTALPGTRELADDLQLNRKTVVLAYEDLAAQGWLESEVRRGTFVSRHLPAFDKKAGLPTPVKERKIPVAPDFAFRQRDIQSRYQQTPKRTLEITDGTPDVRLAPIDVLARIHTRLFRQMGHQNGLGYSDPRGTATLREALVQMLGTDRGLNLTPDNICVTRGSQMAIYLAAQVLCRPGDVVVVEELSYPPAWEAFRMAGADIVPVKLDDDGICPDALEKICRKKRVTAVYLTPHHQFPTTVLLKMPRRLRILDLAAQFGFAIVEDDYDHEFHFAQKPVLPLATFNNWEHVIYIGSMSKLLAPGMRCGYIAAPVKLIAEIAQLIMVIDRQGNQVMENTIAEMINSGELKRHSGRATREYEKRRNNFTGYLGKHFADRFRFDVPDGGLAVWVNLLAGADVGAIIQAAASAGVQCIPGSQYSVLQEKTNSIRMGFASLKEDEAISALAKLKKSVFN